MSDADAAPAPAPAPDDAAHALAMRNAYLDRIAEAKDRRIVYTLMVIVIVFIMGGAMFLFGVVSALPPRDFPNASEKFAWQLESMLGSFFMSAPERLDDFLTEDINYVGAKKTDVAVFLVRLRAQIVCDDLPPDLAVGPTPTPSGRLLPGGRSRRPAGLQNQMPMRVARDDDATLADGQTVPGTRYRFEILYYRPGHPTADPLVYEWEVEVREDGWFRGITMPGPWSVNADAPIESPAPASSAASPAASVSPEPSESS
jgi:hypothetical protein